MTYTPIAKGTPNWDVPLNAALAQLDASITSNASTALQAANNLSDLTNTIQARNNLGISQGTTKGINNYNVKDYGAVGNGVADDAAAISSAITAASSTGGIILFPPGNYLVNSGTGFSVASSGTVIMGSGMNNTQILIGAGFTGTSLFTFTANYGTVRDITLAGNNGTVTSNPAAHGVTASGAQTFRVFNTTFLNINGYAIRAIGTASTTLHGGMIHNTKIQSCAGGVYIISDNSNTAANFMISNLFTRFLGVTSGVNANLDGIHIEDSWDVLMQNVMPWMNSATGGTGAALRIKGNCAAIFTQNLDALGPQTGTNVVIEDGPNGSPQNVQITGGVIQQGNVGLLISGGANQVRVSTVRIINNQTHGVSVTSTSNAINIDRCFFSLNGQAATGTNYDINWSGSATGFITFCRFASPIVSTGTAGVQFSVNVTAGQAVRILDADFAGTGAAQANWVTAFPTVFTHTEGGNYEFFGSVNFSFSGPGRITVQPSTTTNSIFSSNTNGTGANDNFRILGNGDSQYGAGGGSARDTTWGRQGAAQIGTPNSDIFVNSAGKTLVVKNGTNAKAGTVTANGTTAVTVSTTAVTANSAIILSYKSGTQGTGTAWVSALTAGTSFQIKSVSGDSAVYNWVIIEQA